MKRRICALLPALALAGCMAAHDDLVNGPTLSPVGNGLDARHDPVPVTFRQPPQRTFRSTWDQNNSGNIYRDLRASKVGDVIRVTISIDDKAQFDNATNRSRDAKTAFGIDSALGLSGFKAGANAASGSGNVDVNSSTSTKGKGTIDRSEKLTVSLAAVITDVMPNGNLMIRGSQEILVNYEVRVLNIAGIVNPLDVSSSNVIPYDKIAEARISYGGRGRSMDVQQPGLGQRIYDRVIPF